MRGEVFTTRLRLVPIGPEHVADLVAIHRDAWIAEWCAGEWSKAAAEAFATACARGWMVDGVAKWIAYERRTGALVGRGGLSRMASGSASEQIGGLVGPAWAEQRLELGWALQEEFRGRGYATEIGRAGLGFAFDVMGAHPLTSWGPTRSLPSRNGTTRPPGTSWSVSACG